jgi:protein involved in polysaccharide export with SLBB domain
MKNVLIAPFALIAIAGVTTYGQVKSVSAANNQPGAMTTAPTPNSANATRTRVLGRDAKPSLPGSYIARNVSVHSKPDNNHSESYGFRRVEVNSDKSVIGLPIVNKDVSGTEPTNSKPSSTDAPATTSGASPILPVATAPSQVYRVGIRDVLDIQLDDNPSRSSTLFTVLDDGLLEYPLAGDPISVAGLTASEIATLLRQRIKFLDNPAVEVNVRDYASHTISITGFVGVPGTKTLRREAVPLYTLLAEAMTFPEAAIATITHQGRLPVMVDLKDPNQSSMLIVPGDAIKVTGAPPVPTEFFFAGGEINAPGQKPFHTGLTLTQAILASGGTTASAGTKVRVSRQGTDGRLITEEYNLRKIQSGKVPDPAVQSGDRIEVSAN